jgi:Fe-S cluster assembly protein SufD
MNNPKNVMTVLSGTEVNFHEVLTPVSHLNNENENVIILEAGATLTHSIKVQGNFPFHLNTTIKVHKNARYELKYFFSNTSSAPEWFFNLNVELLEENASASIEGGLALKGQVRFFQNCTLHHLSPHTTSSQLYKNTLDDQSDFQLLGNIIVDPAAFQTNAQLKNKNLLLSQKAHVITKPELIIGNADVKCSHGATTGQLQLEELFYLMSRGFSPEKAKGLLLESFFGELNFPPSLYEKKPDLLEKRS